MASAKLVVFQVAEPHPPELLGDLRQHEGALMPRLGAAVAVALAQNFKLPLQAPHDALLLRDLGQTTETDAR